MAIGVLKKSVRFFESPDIYCIYFSKLHLNIQVLSCFCLKFESFSLLGVLKYISAIGGLKPYCLCCLMYTLIYISTYRRLTALSVVRFFEAMTSNGLAGQLI